MEVADGSPPLVTGCLTDNGAGVVTDSIAAYTGLKRVGGKYREEETEEEVKGLSSVLQSCRTALSARFVVPRFPGTSTGTEALLREKSNCHHI